jgi:hypothetical protein
MAVIRTIETISTHGRSENMKRVIYHLSLAILLTIGVIGGGATMKVSSPKIAPGESLRVQLVAEGENVEFPKIKSIAGFPIERKHLTSKVESRYINGDFTLENRKILEMEIFPDKNFTIPSYTVAIDGKKYKTKPRKIEVSKRASGGGSHGFSIEMKSDKRKLYVGEPAIITVDVSEPSNIPISRIEYQPPEFKDFFVKSLGGEKQFRRGEQTVHEMRYLLVPQKEGRIEIPPAKIKVGIRDINNPVDPFGIFGNTIKWYSVASSALGMDISPIPKNTDIVGRYKIESDVDRSEVDANKPVNYTLKITGEGSLEDIEDPSFDIPGVTVYSDDAQVETKIVDGKPLGSYIKKYVFISDRDFTIPPVEFREFDYKDGKSKILHSQAHSIRVKGGSVAKAPAGRVETPKRRPETSTPAEKTENMRKRNETGPTAVETPAVKENILRDDAYYKAKEYREKSAMLWWYIAGAFLCGAISALLLLKIAKSVKWGASAKKKRKNYTAQEAFKILYPHMDDDPEVEALVRDMYEHGSGKKKSDIDQEKLNRLASRYDPENGDGMVK